MIGERAGEGDRLEPFLLEPHVQIISEVVVEPALTQSNIDEYVVRQRSGGDVVAPRLLL